jgi:phytoene/squalene synthetase
LQLANHWQDIARDFRIGRCYIPNEVAVRFGVDRENLAETDDFRRMMWFLIDDARSRLRFGTPLINSVPRLIRKEVALFQHGGLAVLDAIEKVRFNVLEHRPSVSHWTKLRLLLGALLLAGTPGK